MPRVLRYGAEAGPVVAYFHGSPGAPEECAGFDEAARACGVRLLALDRGTFGPRLDAEAYPPRLAAELETLAGHAPLHVAGFSMGAFAALRTARHLGGRIASLDLISGAAPLELGDFLPAMVGRPVFATAQRSRALLGMLSVVQGGLATWAPTRLFDLLFTEARGADRELAQDPAFRAMIGSALRVSLGPGRRGYVRDVARYVRPWAAELAEIRNETWIWHGAEDDWTPPTMAEALRRALPAADSHIEIAPGLSHYSCLFQAMPRVLARVGGR